jgi:hypothetical protein
MAWIQSGPHATANCASNEHLAVVVVALIAAGCGMQAGWRDR